MRKYNVNQTEEITEKVEPVTKKSTKKRAKKASVNVANSITSKIPYLHCYEECGMFEIEANTYSITYAITPPDQQPSVQYIRTIAYDSMKNILCALKDFNFRFTIRNSYVSEDEYLKTLLLPENKSDKVNSLISDYNDVLRNNVNIGHNNFKMTLYLTLVTNAEVPDDALTKFQDSEAAIVSGFEKLYGYKASMLSLSERLEVLYDIYHPDADSPAFGSKVDYDGNGFSLTSMKRMKMNTKDVIAPKFYEAKERNYFRLGDKFGRMLFINSIPANVTDSLFFDLISISSNSMLSVTYQPIDADFGFQASARLVKDNITVKNVTVRDTIEDIKNHRIERTETMIKEDEEAYFNKAALEVFTDAAAKEQPVMLVTFIVAVFSDTLDDLERDTMLLKISANKYSCPLKVFDLQQHEAFVSALPLGSMQVDIPRLFPAERLSKLLPVNVQSFLDKDVVLQGLNEINGNFVLVDRKNYSLGMITGTKNSGKTFALKREIANTLMSSDDTIVVIANKNKKEQYEAFVKNLDGVVYDPILTDLFSCDKDYGVTIARDEFKQMFLNAFITLRNGFHKKRHTAEELQALYDETEREADMLCKYDDYLAAVAYAREHGNDFKLFNRAILNYVPTNAYPDFRKSKVNIVYFENASELLMQLDYAWNCAITMKKANHNMCIFIDDIDEFVFTPAASDYLLGLLDKCKALKVPITCVVQDSAQIVSNSTSKIEFDYLIEKMEYFKLLSQGVLERKHFTRQLGISRSLVPYITDAEPGEGIIITPSTNVSFNDRFETSENPFYGRFY